MHTISLFFFKYMYYQSSFNGCKCISLFYRNIRTVSIQIEITKYLYKCLTNPDPEVTMPTPVSDSKRPYLPTMFGNTKTRTDLVNMVHMSLYLIFIDKRFDSFAHIYISEKWVCLKLVLFTILERKFWFFGVLIFQLILQ